jgi:dienelactone hydrolase
MRLLAFVGSIAGLLLVAALLVLPYWRAAWILAASANAPFPVPPGITSARTEDVVLDGIQARVYRPDGTGRYPTLVMAHSFNPDGERDPRLAASLLPIARSGVVLVVPRLTSATANRIDYGDVSTLVGAFAASPALPYVSSSHRGLGGYSWSAGYAVLAAAHEQIRDDVRLVLSVGGYASADSMFIELTTHLVERPDGTVRSWIPDAWAEQVARSEVARRFGSAASAAEEWQALSPIAHARAVRAPVALLHGVNDPVVPEEETLRLQRALEPHTKVVTLETGLLHHVNLGDVRSALSSEGIDAIYRMADIIRWALAQL